jgi:hypothetical protein
MEVSRELELRAELVVGQLDGADHQIFGEIADVRAAEGETFFVLDRQAREVWWYESSGEPVASLRQRGSGPGELARPRAIDVSDHGTVTVFDDTNSRYSVYDVTDAEFRFLGSFEPLGGEVTVGRHVCSVRDRVFIQTVHDGRLIHEVSLSGEILRSFGSIEHASEDSFGPAAPMVEAVKNSGHLTCFTHPDVIVAVGRYLPLVRAFSLDGEQIWQSELNDIRNIGFGPGVGLNPIIDDEHGSHMGESVVRWNEERLLVQYSVTWPDGIGADDRDRDHYLVESRLLEIDSGREVARSVDLPLVVDASQGRYFGFRNVPVPQVVAYRRAEP